jgi:protein-S-isoprenylcysteine O-methyltransferase Ste14
MKATNFEFRLRMWLMIAMVFIGFWAPWSSLVGSQGSATALGWLAVEISRTGLLPFASAAPAMVIAGALAAALGALLRVWSAAYLGYSTVHDSAMRGSTMMADGPYRFVRNPLYLGGWFMMFSVCLLMPVAGAPASFLLLSFFFLRLILAEEAFLIGQLGQPYRDYLHAVPRLFPRLRGALPAAGHKPDWLTALITEINPIGVFFAFAFLSWNYDVQLMMKGILVSFGLAMLLRGIFHNTKEERRQTI